MYRVVYVLSRQVLVVLTDSDALVICDQTGLGRLFTVPGEYLGDFWVVMCRWDPEILSLHQSYNSSSEFFYPIVD